MPENGGWYDCWVEKAGPAEDGRIYIRLKDGYGAFPYRWFCAVDSMKREMLAVALAAMQSGAPVSAALQSASEYSQIDRLYMIRPPSD